MSFNLTLRAALAATLIAALALAGLTPAHAQTAPDAAASEPAAAAPAETAAPAAEPPAPVAPPLEPMMTKEEVANPFGLAGMWKAADPVKRGTLVILLIMSMASWYVLILKFLETRSMIKTGRKGIDAFWKASDPKAGMSALEEGSALRYVAERGLHAAENHAGSMAQSVDRHTWINMSIERAVGSVQSRLSNGMSLLATVGSTAPFVGLFGTTWGIYSALVDIGLSGQASIDRVAGPVGAALILTAIGLAVAVPAVMGYNWMVRRNKVVLDQTRAFAGDLETVLLSGRR